MVKKHPPIRCTVSCELRNLWKNNFKKQKTVLERIKDTIRSNLSRRKQIESNGNRSFFAIPH